MRYELKVNRAELAEGLERLRKLVKKQAKYGSHKLAHSKHTTTQRASITEALSY